MEKQKFNLIDHDIKTPLRSILLNSKNLSDKIQKLKIPKEQKELLQKELDGISGFVKDAKYIIHDVMDEDCGSDSFESLQNVIENLVKRYEYIYGGGIRSYEVCDETVEQFYNFDQYKLIRIINNLLSNSTKFTSRGMIIVHIDEDKDYYIVTVKDSGFGISKKKVEEILATENSENLYDAGVGLIIVRDLVREMGGKLKISTSVGKGTNVTISLPKIKSDVMKIGGLNSIVENIIEVKDKLIYKLQNESD